MILKELADLARREGLVDDPDYEPKAVRWIIGIGSGGKFLGVTEPEGLTDARGKLRPKVFQVPRSPVRTFGSVANFLIDKAEYVLGFDPDDSPNKRAKLRERRTLFAEYVETALGVAPGDAGLVALLGFLRDDNAVALALGSIRDRVVSNDLIAFRYSDGDESEMMHDRVAVRAAWKKLRHPPHDQNALQYECLVCGKA